MAERAANAIALRNETPIAAFQAYADEQLASAIAGDLLKFAKGDWLRGEGKETVPADAMFLCNMIELWQGWTKWEDGKPIEHRLQRLADRQPKILRSDLGDFDQAQWEKDANGAPRDPWQQTDRLIMRDDCSQELVTFVTGSYGGRWGLAKLCRSYVQEAKKYPGKFPVIRLGVDKTWRHESYGIIPRPVFTVIGWSFWDEEAAAAAPDAKAIEAPSDFAKELDDEIPF